MKYLVTGAAGFIGSRLVARLLRAGEDVVGLDDLSAGRRANVAHHVGDHRFSFVEGTTMDGELVERLVGEVDVVFHLADIVGVRRVLTDPLAVHLGNTVGAANVIGSASMRSAPLVVTSSSEVYGRNPSLPWREESDRVLGPTSVARWAYAQAKAEAESIAFAHQRLHGAPIAIARLFNVAGPGQPPASGMVLPRFVDQALAGTDLTVHGDGNQTRCFTHVDDVVDALLALSARADGVARAFNVGSTEEVSINQLAARVVSLTGSSSGIVHLPYVDTLGREIDDPPRRVPDTTRIEAQVGWVPLHGLDDIIRSVIEDRVARSTRGSRGPMARLPDRLESDRRDR